MVFSPYSLFLLFKREAQYIFIKSVPLTVNELHETEKAYTMRFVHFLEGICRLGDGLNVPDEEMMEAVGAKDGLG
jgi:hypothetical protein